MVFMKTTITMNIIVFMRIFYCFEWGSFAVFHGENDIIVFYIRLLRRMLKIKYSFLISFVNNIYQLIIFYYLYYAWMVVVLGDISKCWVVGSERDEGHASLMRTNQF